MTPAIKNDINAACKKIKNISIRIYFKCVIVFFNNISEEITSTNEFYNQRYSMSCNVNKMPTKIINCYK